MKIALGIIARPVESLLVLCLRPVIAQFDGLIMLTSEEPEWKDGVSFLVHNERKFSLYTDYKWVYNYADARNTLIAHAEKLEYDWILMLDADESMLPDDLVSLRQYMETQESLIFSRYEFVDDFEHFCPLFYPDYQARAFKLNMGYNYTGLVHEYLHKGTDKPAYQMPYSTLLPHLHIFHYGKSKPSEEVWAKIDAYNQIASGHPIRTRPTDVPLPASWSLGSKKVKFIGSKPL